MRNALSFACYMSLFVFIRNRRRRRHHHRCGRPMLSDIHIIEVVRIWPNSKEYLRFWRNSINVLPLVKHSAPFWPKHLTSRVNANVVYVFTHYYSKVSECRTVRFARYTCFDNEVHDVSHRQRRHRIFIALDRVNVRLEFINMQNKVFFSPSLPHSHSSICLSCSRALVVYDLFFMFRLMNTIYEQENLL